MDAGKIRDIIKAKTGVEPLRLGEEQLVEFGSFLVRPDAREYLTACLSEEGYQASGVNVCSVTALHDENLSGASPGMFIFPHGYLVFATSIGGNALCVHDSSGRVYWAEHDAFSDYWVTYKDPETGEYEDLPPTAENISKAMTPVADRLEDFLLDLLGDRLTDKLDELD